MKESFLIHLNQLDSSYLVLLSLAGLGIAAAILIYTGLASWIFCVLSRIVRGSIRKGFLVWERLFAWASWPSFCCCWQQWEATSGEVGVTSAPPA